MLHRFFMLRCKNLVITRRAPREALRIALPAVNSKSRCEKIAVRASALRGLGGGRGGIRTHGWLAPSPVFKTGALNHSATLPALRNQILGGCADRVPVDPPAGLLPYRLRVRQRSANDPLYKPWRSLSAAIGPAKADEDSLAECRPCAGTDARGGGTAAVNAVLIVGPP
jgi:hypothetical protein